MTPEELKSKIGMHGSLALLGSELKEMAKMIYADETVGRGAFCNFNGKAGLMVATDRRAIFVSKFLFSLSTEEFNYEKISTVQFESGLMSSDLIFSFSGSKVKFTSLLQSDGKDMAEYIKAQCNKPKASPAPIHQTVQPVDPMDQILKLSQLKEQGIITEEEFAAKKKLLLGL